MKKLALVALLTAGVATSAVAKHDGAYVGVNVGYGTHQVKNHHKDGKDKLDTSHSGVVGGAQMGWDFMFNNQYLLGAEASVDLTNQDGAKEAFTVLGKMGYMVTDNFLTYVALGWTNKKVDGKKSFVSDEKGNKRVNAFTAGLGMSTMVTENIEFGGEYRHDFFAKKKFKGSDDKYRLAADSFRLKLAYKM